MQAADLEVIKEIPGYKVILKTVLKSQIQQLVEQLADHTGEESVILTASIADGSLSHLGSESGKAFLEEHDDIKSQFLGFCLKRHHKQKQIEKEKQEQEEQQRQNAANTPQGYNMGPRPRFAPSRLHSGQRFQSAPGHQFGQRHQPYPTGHPRTNFGQGVKRPGGAMRLRPEQNKTPKIDTNPNPVIKTELPDAENTTGNNMDQSVGDTTESSNSAVNNALENIGGSNFTSSLQESLFNSGENTTLSQSAIVKGEQSDLSARNGDSVSADSIETSASMSDSSNVPETVASVNEPNVIVKTETEDDSEELEITGVEPGQMSVSDNTWMPNIQSSIGYTQSVQSSLGFDPTIQTSIGYEPTVSGAGNMGGAVGQGYGAAGKKQCQVCGKWLLPTSMSLHMKLHSSERFTCKYCGKPFVQKSSYQCHMYTKHNVIA